VLLGGRVTLNTIAARTGGVAWLVVALALLVVATGVWRQSYSISMVLSVIVASLILCVAWWPVARIGLWVNLAILVMVVGVTYGSFRRDIGELRARLEGRATVVQTTRGPIEYVEVGTGQAVIAIHGTGGGWDQGIDATLPLLPDGFRVISPSRFGYLGTPMIANASPEAEADLFAALLDDLNVDRATVISYSAGTAPALQFALRHPDRVSALILVVPAAGGILPPQTRGPPPFVMNVVARYDFPMWVAARTSPSTVYKLVGMPPDLVASLPPEEAESVNQTVRSLLPVSRRVRGMIYDAHSQSGVVPTYPLERITMPTLLISAADDLYHTLDVARHAAGRIPGARVLSFPTGGHLLAGRAAEIRAVLQDFLRVPPDPELHALRR
jgi:pimeloyl-ACP methyl ester carboxylesterase